MIEVDASSTGTFQFPNFLALMTRYFHSILVKFTNTLDIKPRIVQNILRWIVIICLIILFLVLPLQENG